MFQTFISRHNSNFFSDKLVLTSVTPASSAPVLQTPKATSSTLYFDSLTVNATLRLSPLRRGLAIDSTVDIFTFYVPHRHVYGEQWIKFMKDGVNATPL